MADYKAYRGFVNDLVPHVKETNTVRMWGGLTWIKDNPVTEIDKEAIENVEMNLWSADWADGIEMYNMGYDLINTIDNFGLLNGVCQQELDELAKAILQIGNSSVCCSFH